MRPGLSRASTTDGVRLRDDQTGKWICRSKSLIEIG